MKPYRSWLFVPGHKPDWINKAVAAGADALILDLEDAVPAQQKAAARDQVRASIQRLASTAPQIGIFVRPNSWESGLAGDDVAAVVQPGLDGLFLPKVYGERDLLHFETLADYFEGKNEVDAGRVVFVVALETATAMADARSLLTASSRVQNVMAAAIRNGDIARSLGYQWTTQGLETLYLRSKIVMDARAAGIDYPLGGLWQEIKDLDGLAQHARFNRQLGFRGEVVIHPSHVAIVNRIYTPSEEEVAYMQGMLEAFAAAEAQGHAAVQYQGEHIDYAHVRTAKDLLAFVEALRERGERI